jgi:ATP-dependent metalloprotease
MTFENSSRRKTALHEAGHACIAIIASGGSNVPDYATVVPSKNFEGVVFESLSYYDKMEDFTYNNMLLKTRVFLAGRAAEDLFYGSANVSSGANSDLAAATQMCFSLFAYSGFNSDMATAESSAHNLAVLNSRDIDPVQYDRISREVRAFLQEQYKYVLTTLEENRPFVESVAERLLWDPVVDQSEMIELATRFGLNAHPE